MMCDKCGEREATAFIYRENNVVDNLCIGCYKNPYVPGGVKHGEGAFFND